MALGVDDKSRSILESEEFLVSEFGRVNPSWLDLSKKYKGAIFKLNSETIKQTAEIVGFSANFDLPGIRTATIDLFNTEGHIVFEIERNTKPTELAIRYSRERWQLLESLSRSAENLRPWISTEYKARFISEKLMALVAEQLNFNASAAGSFVIRLNFKDKTFGLIVEESFAEKMPAGGFSAFTLPSRAMLALAMKLQSDSSEPDRQTVDPVYEEPPADSRAPAGEVEPARLDKSQEEEKNESNSTDLKENKTESPASTKQTGRVTEVESSSAKYATYSRSEVDQMFKQHGETIANALGSKISSQQRVFQEAVEKQEKSFAKISDSFVAQFDQTRSRLETVSKQSEETIRGELDSFKKELNKELEQYRAQINKTVVPVAKFIEEKNAKSPDKSQEKAPKQDQAKVSTGGTGELFVLKPLLITNLVLVLIVLGALFAVVMPDIARIQDLEKQIQELNYKLKSVSLSPSAGNLSGNQAPDASPVSVSGSN